MLDHAACNIIYLDKRAREEVVRRDSLLAKNQSATDDQGEYFKVDGFAPPQEVQSNIESILTTFNEGKRIRCFTPSLYTDYLQFKYSGQAKPVLLA
jgi:hypothetical protein